MKKRIVLLTINIALGLSACGGGGNAGNGSATITGHIGDGYIQGAYVCHDSDSDMDCLDETVYVTSAIDGSFSLSNFDATKDLLAQIPVGAIDHGPFVNTATVSRTINKSLWYYLPANVNNVFISPLSTLVHEQKNKMPSMSLSEAENVVKVKLGEKENSVISLFDNFIEGAQKNDKLHAMAEVVHQALETNIDAADTTYSNKQKQWYASGQILDNLERATQRLPTSLAGFDPTTLLTNVILNNGQYGNQIAQLMPFLSSIVTIPTDLCAELNNGYYALEEWNPVSSTSNNEQEHKKLFLDSSDILQISSRYYAGNVWVDNNNGTSSTNSYQSHLDGTIIDMSAVNGSSYTKPMYDLPMPASKVSCDGETAIFDANGFKYKLYVAGVDLSIVPNNLLTTLGQQSSNIVAATVFQSGDMVYASAMVKIGDSYVVGNGTNSANTPIPLSLYSVYKDTGGPPYTVAPYMDTVATLLSDDLLINYRDDTTFIKIERVSATQVTVQKIENATQIASSNHNYVIETHNGFDFLIIKDYEELNNDIFIGRVDSASTSNMVWGKVFRSGSYGLVSHPGDMMDDLMINEVARDRIFAANNVIYSNNSASYIKLDVNGNPLADQSLAWNNSGNEAMYTQWSCVKDPSSNLIWEVKQGGNNTQGDEGLHDADDKYTWYNTDSTTNSSNAGYDGVPWNTSCSGYVAGDNFTFCNTESYVARVNIANFCGSSGGWRMPAVDELTSILDTSQTLPKINSSYFPNTKTGFGYWSSETHTSNSADALDVGFGNDFFGSYAKSGVGRNVRLVHE